MATKPSTIRHLEDDGWLCLSPGETLDLRRLTSEMLAASELRASIVERGGRKPSEVRKERRRTRKSLRGTIEKKRSEIISFVLETIRVRDERLKESIDDPDAVGEAEL